MSLWGNFNLITKYNDLAYFSIDEREARLALSDRFSDIDVLVSLQKYGLLPEAVRVYAVNEIRNLAISVPDSGFLRDEIRSLLSDNEFSEILSEVKDNLLPNLESLVDDWKADYNFEHDPDSYFDELKTAIDDYKSIFSGDDESEKHINLASALLFQGKWEAAKEIYLSLKDKPFNNSTYKSGFLEDLDAFEKAGITHTDVAKVRALLSKWGLVKLYLALHINNFLEMTKRTTNQMQILAFKLN